MTDEGERKEEKTPDVEKSAELSGKDLETVAGGVSHGAQVQGTYKWFNPVSGDKAFPKAPPLLDKAIQW